MSSRPLRLRKGVRALVIDPDERVLLVRFEFPKLSLWAAPGGGVEPGEDPHDALRRELLEEAGMAEPDIGAEVWHRTHIIPFLSGNYDGQTERFFLVRATAFEPQPTQTWEQLRGECMTAIRWWTLDELDNSDELFAPRRLHELLVDLLTTGPPEKPIDSGV